MGEGFGDYLHIEHLNGRYSATAPLIDDVTRDTLMRLAQRKDEAIASALKLLGWIAPEDVEAHDAQVAERAWDEARKWAAELVAQTWADDVSPVRLGEWITDPAQDDDNPYRANRLANERGE